jgi:hypothetical protein
MSVVFVSDESIQGAGFQAFYGVDCNVQVPLALALASCGMARLASLLEPWRIFLWR